MIVSEVDQYQSVEMKKQFFTILITCAVIITGRSQSEQNDSLVQNPDFATTINAYLDFSVPIISCNNFRKNQDKFTVLDAREPEEFEVSHIKHAIPVGFQDFNLAALESIDKSKPIVVYCSIGYRSEKIAKKLKGQGFSQVYNLYGSIFEWVNEGFPVYNNADELVLKVHTYNRKWSRWVDVPKIEKVW